MAWTFTSSLLRLWEVLLKRPHHRASSKKKKTLWKYEYSREAFAEALEGIRPCADIDWFAKDRDGEFGVFCSGGFGPIPRAALNSFDAHRRAATELYKEQYDTGHLDMLGCHGLYVFDWSYGDGRHSANRPYIRQSKPLHQEVTLTASMRGALEPCAIRLDVRFRDNEEVILEHILEDLSI